MRTAAKMRAVSSAGCACRMTKPSPAEEPAHSPKTAQRPTSPIRTTGRVGNANAGGAAVSREAGSSSRNRATTAPTAHPNVDPLKYQSHQVIKSDDLLTLKLRYKQPDGNTSSKIEIPATDSGISYAKASDDFKFAAAVAQFGMILRGSAEKGTASLDGVIELADEGKGKDEKGYRAEFVELVKKAKALVK